MKSLEEIKKKFEHKEINYRSDFINDYDFDDEHIEYYKSFILDTKDIKNHLYLSDLIDLAGWLGIYDRELYLRYVDYLLTKQHYVVKLAVLDYLMRSDVYYDDIDIEKILFNFIQKNKIEILGIQAMLNLILLNSKNKKTYIDMLIYSLLNTKDWKVLYRVINKLNQEEIDIESKTTIFNYIFYLIKNGSFDTEERKSLLVLSGGNT